MSWPADPLCSTSDLEIEVGGNLILWCQSEDAQVRTQAGLAINRGHKQVCDELQADLPDLFKDLNGWEWYGGWLQAGYTLTYLDNVLTFLDNGTGTNTAGAPIYLKDWESAVSLFWLSNQMIGKFQIVGESTVNIMADQRTFWGGKDGTGGQSLIRKDRLYKQLKLAITNYTGDFNRVRVQRRLVRV